jgi:hypothetical protein
MQESKSYRQYAADCRRMARTMSAKDQATLMKMAEAWEARADEAERQERKQQDGKDQHV